jgi:hypothetical protein
VVLPTRAVNGAWACPWWYGEAGSPRVEGEAVREREKRGHVKVESRKDLARAS